MRLAATTTTDPVERVPDEQPLPTAGSPGRPQAGTRVYTPVPRFSYRLADLWRYRGLLRYFGKVYIQKRYRRTWLGWLWIPIRPTLDVAGRVLLFGSLLGVASGTRPYFMFFIVGATAWRFFSIGVIWAARALELNANLFNRVHLPRVSAVAASIVPAAIEAGIFALIGLVGAVYYKVTQGSFFLFVGPSSLAALAGIALLALYVVAIGLWTAPIGYHARDIRFILTYVLGFWYVITPVIYPISSIPEKFRPLAEYNPLTAPVEFVKYGILQTAPPTDTSIVVSLVVLGALLVGGVLVFARAEARAAAAV
ncbi:MAG: ABC transporter permease [Gaiellaceae bacterium]